MYSSNNVWEKSTYYVLDAQGKSQLRLVKMQQRQTSVRKLPGTMSVYQHALDNVNQLITFAQTEKHIYGSSRLGTNTEKVPMFGSQNNTYSIVNVRHRMGSVSVCHLRQISIDNNLIFRF